MRFLVDAQLPPSLVSWLEERGHHAEHVADCGLLTAKDSQVWDYAVTVGAVVVTKDEDFAHRRALAQGPPSILWIRFGNTRKSELLERLDGLLTTVVAAVERGETLIELA